MNAQVTGQTQAVRFESPRLIEPEDQVRADYYALLANLFYRAPDARLLQAMVISAEPLGDSPNPLSKAWADLAAASGVVTADAVEDEYQSLFIGVGRPPVMLYGSFYLAGFMNEKPLAELRGSLSRLGYARDSNATEPEDHLAALCDVMRAMILGDVSHAPASIDAQREFFVRHMQPWVLKCCAAITENEKANYYMRVAAFACAFFEIEIQAFEM
ncbi:MAG: molecular chaperone TorD family protein [Betaproteobacteria bacterium]|nr:molecular chaperone TorD family protein [Betaproteobacteria bacterium]